MNQPHELQPVGEYREHPQDHTLDSLKIGSVMVAVLVIIIIFREGTRKILAQQRPSAEVPILGSQMMQSEMAKALRIKEELASRGIVLPQNITEKGFVTNEAAAFDFFLHVNRAMQSLIRLVLVDKNFSWTEALKKILEGTALSPEGFAIVIAVDPALDPQYHAADFALFQQQLKALQEKQKISVCIFSKNPLAIPADMNLPFVGSLHEASGN